MSEQAAPASTSDAPQDPPDAPAPQAEADAPQPPAEPEQRSGGGKKKLLGIVGAIVAIAVVGGLKFGLGTLLAGEDEAAEAKTGDCIAELSADAVGEEQTEVDGAKVVACTDSTAVYNVVGRVDGQTEAQARTGEACDPFFKESDDGYVFSSIKPGSTGYLLCLTKRA
ncbi:LppU/SCO3897 family protein [Micromonospora endophytica]|uniref:LppU/SCO3897 family protein n=1 Tax=Micromonospora endophytica TaxID=515350 RepID=UPI001C32A303|nr:hypothetical protein [Micromonospora endophytica]BCJ58536.1 hypothetical protein Jiend_19580 [Micromonospora endophytica]